MRFLFCHDFFTVHIHRSTDIEDLTRVVISYEIYEMSMNKTHMLLFQNLRTPGRKFIKVGKSLHFTEYFSSGLPVNEGTVSSECILAVVLNCKRYFGKTINMSSQ